MSRLLFGAVLMLAAQRTALCQSPQGFAMRLTRLYETSFARGGLLKIPKERVKEVDFSLGPPGSRYVRDGSVSIRINGQPAERDISHAGEDLVITVKAGEEGDVLAPTGPTKVELSVRGMPEFSRTWIIETHELPFVIETSGSEDGVPLEITLKKPVPPLMMGRGSGQTLAFQGTVNRRTPIIHIAGQAIDPNPKDEFSCTFSGNVNVGAQQREVVVEATGSHDDSCRIVMPIRRL